MVSENYSKSWEEMLDNDMLLELENIQSQIGNQFTPKNENILRFLEKDLDKMKVCIIGQDPYYSVDQGELVANGRAFQPNNLADWAQPYRQVSLKNMIRLIHKNYTGIENYCDIKKYNEIVKEIKAGEFKIQQPKEWFDSIEAQGVLLINRYLTTEVGTANMHRKIWDKWVAKVIAYIDEKRPDMIWFLWGNAAISCEKYLNNGIIYKNRHPMMCSDKYDDDFLKAVCFEKTMDIINWLG